MAFTVLPEYRSPAVAQELDGREELVAARGGEQAGRHPTAGPAFLPTAFAEQASTALCHFRGVGEARAGLAAELTHERAQQSHIVDNTIAFFKGRLSLCRQHIEELFI
jgi:hypothetical protein